jgi:hypothetical protein
VTIIEQKSRPAANAPYMNAEKYGKLKEILRKIYQNLKI